MMDNHQKQQNYMTRFTVFSFNYKVKEAFICFLLMNEGYFLPIFCLYWILPVSWELSNDFSNKTIISGFITLEIMPSLLSSLVSLSRLITMKNSNVEVTEIGNFSSHCSVILLMLLKIFGFVSWSCTLLVDTVTYQ